MEKENEIKENYVKNLKAAGYVTMMEEHSKHYPDFHRVPLTFLYEVLHSGKFKGSRLLDLGSGACVHVVSLATAFYPNVIMSDFVEDNCEELKRWLRGESDLRQPLDVPAEIEGYGGDLEAGRQLLENRIRNSLKQVVRCDVLNDNIILEEVKPEVTPPYDFIISSLCLEAAAPDLESFLLVLKRICKILRKGGGLFLVGFLEAKPWEVDEKEFHYLEISETDLKQALEDSGFGNTDIRVRDRFDFDYDHKGFYCLVTEKL